MPRKSLVLLAFTVALFILAWTQGWLRTASISSTDSTVATAAPFVVKHPPSSTRHTFDPAAPPPGMPPLREGELAECESNFVSDASVGGTLRRLDSTHAIITVTQVKMILELQINVWIPVNATEHVLEHEDGHRQIAEAYYQTADRIASQLAAPYIGKQIPITAPDLDSQFSNTLQQLSKAISADYSRKLNPDAAQLRFDDLTDHSRNDLAAQDAVTQSLAELAH